MRLRDFQSWGSRILANLGQETGLGSQEPDEGFRALEFKFHAAVALGSGFQIGFASCRLHYVVAVGLGSDLATTYSKPLKLENGLRPNSAGIPCTLLLRIEAIGFPTLGLLLYSAWQISCLGRGALSCQHNPSAEAYYKGLNNYLYYLGGSF